MALEWWPRTRRGRRRGSRPLATLPGRLRPRHPTGAVTPSGCASWTDAEDADEVMAPRDILRRKRRAHGRVRPARERLAGPPAQVTRHGSGIVVGAWEETGEVAVAVVQFRAYGREDD